MTWNIPTQKLTQGTSTPLLARSCDIGRDNTIFHNGQDEDIELQLKQFIETQVK
jgi:hypothetical protein